MPDFIPQNIAQSLYDLLAKLDDLKASLDTGLTVTVDAPSVTVNVQGCGGCTGGGGAGIVESPPELAPPPGEPPPGYEDTDEWLQRKCGIIEKVIFPNWQRDLEQVNNLDLAGLSVELVASAVVIVVLTPIPFDDILLIAAIIVGFLLIGISHNLVMNPAIDYVSNLDPCLLAWASSPEAAVQALLNDIDAQEFDALVDTYTKGVLRSFVNHDLVNILFAPNPPLSASVTSTACDECEPDCPDLLAVFGTITDQGAGYVEATPVLVFGYQLVHIQFNVSNNCNQEITSVSIIEGDFVGNPNVGCPGLCEGTYHYGTGLEEYTRVEFLEEMEGQCAYGVQVHSGSLAEYKVRIEYSAC